VSEPVKITLGDDVVLCLNGNEYPLGFITGMELIRSDTETVRTVNSDGTSTLRPVMNITKIELACCRTIRQEGQQ
jgi:hypothetical protein